MADLEPYGVKRNDGKLAYIQFCNELKANLRTDKVYTLAFWGISRFLDAIKWEIVGVVPGKAIDFNSFCGKPPVHAVMYFCPDDPKDQRHLQSKKKYAFDLAFWSSLKRPSPERVKELLGETANGCDVGSLEDEEKTKKKKKRGLKAILECCTARPER
eukprot:gnl/MRDRNA2_/MRDRNA2_289736_c0_seq1.p1 gnl/MRDRNA2_/MRDRNA2_289736_c0~~gnl/MRDRNA2_/MRDRNA2_289736_c0_seq1.p1  ORF type:complete len:167 (+),score=41.46 gnl/MRDRNA2_/MRDRNA2_289736_c0_seq1:28-501(+)